MEPEFQQAITDWLIAAMRERSGKSVIAEGHGYRIRDFRECFETLLPKALCEQIDVLYDTEYHHVWPLLTDAEVRIIMEAGAKNFFPVPAE